MPAARREDPDAGTDRGDLPPGLRIGWQGILLILGFWTFFGVVMAASLFLSPLRQSEQAAPAALIIFTFLGAYTWAALTLPLFWLTRRLGLTRDGGTQRIVRIIGLLGFSLVLAIVVSTGLALISSIVLQDLLGGSLAGTEGIWSMARYRFLNDLLACHLVLTAGVARDYFLRYRARQAEATLLRAQLVEARLHVLRTQLNPHFLFNTLNAVATLVTTDPRGVRRMIARLSELLRYTLEGAAEPEIPLEQELEILGRYLEIMEIRFRDRLETEIDADPTLLDALVPNLILQPLVENAMKHGVSRSEGGGHVGVRARRDGDDLVLTVRDSGHEAAKELAGSFDESGEKVGADGESDSGASGFTGGFGLRQTRERLDQLYGPGGRLRLATLPEGGAVAEVRIPFHRTPPSRTGLPASGSSADSSRASESSTGVHSLHRPEPSALSRSHG
ncbi:MAG: histidine kinase [Longimicrobiales bacterium]|nr:histidine kinase [Longimicrobiales bacterium]